MIEIRGIEIQRCEQTCDFHKLHPPSGENRREFGGIIHPSGFLLFRDGRSPMNRDELRLRLFNPIPREVPVQIREMPEFHVEHCRRRKPVAVAHPTDGVIEIDGNG